MFGISYFRLAAYAVIAIAMSYLIYQYRTGQEAKKQVSSITLQLTAERKCTVGSECAKRVEQSRIDSINAVKEAQDKAKAEHERQQQEFEVKLQAELKKNTQIVSSGYAKRLEIEMKHNASCDKWQSEVNPCDMQ